MIEAIVEMGSEEARLLLPPAGAGGGGLPRLRHGAAEGEQQREDPLPGALLRRRHLLRLMYVYSKPPSISITV